MTDEWRRATRWTVERARFLGLLDDAQVMVEIVEPAVLRELIALLLHASAALVRAHTTVWGLPIAYAAELAELIVVVWTAEHGGRRWSRWDVPRCRVVTTVKQYANDAVALDGVGKRQ